MTGGLVIIASGIYIVYREVGEVTVNRYLRAFTSTGPVAMLRRMTSRGQTPPAGD
jgi:hypothetical protein